MKLYDKTYASRELCEELYTISGWEDNSTDSRHYNGVTLSSGKVDSVPAYDLGFLLRKLPDGVKLFRENLYISAEGDSREQWRIEPGDCEYLTTGKEQIELPMGELGSEYPEDVTADTPEDAAVLLCIELFQQGVLQRGGV